jgi:poly-gamma-glutamate capsule biosynthesis protein CapA/YwtB (metallophosphatase superfamily)
MSLVERVARAMFAANGPDGNRYWGEDPEQEWLTYVDDARAAIAAIRVPTVAMIVAGHNLRIDPSYSAEEIYTAMIDAGLAEGSLLTP